ncbi:hypothetical protein SLE2022_290330 [Rubroshorea leprosula]
MNAISIFRGYGKVNHLEDQTPDRRSSQRPLLTTIAIAAVVLLTLVIGSILAAAVIRDYREEEETESPPLSAELLESIKSVCSVTQFPDSCFTAISTLNTSTKPDPESIFKISLRAAIAELSNLSSSINTLNGRNSVPALQDCVTQLDDALSRLNESMSAMEARPGEKTLTEAKINDIQTWVSAAMTDQDTCFDGLEETGSRVLNQVNHGIRQRSKEYISNSLAIVANMPLLLEKFGLKMH